MQDNRLEQPPARQAIRSIPGHWGRWYGGIFAFQYLVFLGLTIWDEVVYRTGDNAVQNILAVQRGMTANILNIAASAYVILEGVMLAQWLKERDQRKQREALEQAREETQEERKKWLAWYERWQDAQREGRPFDEPPPTAPRDDNGK